MTQVSTLQVSATLAEMLDLPMEEVKFDLGVHLDELDRQLELDITRYLEFLDLNAA